MKNLLQKSNIFFDCDPTEVEYLISSLELSKSSCSDNRPVHILHMLQKDISIPWRETFNLYLKTGPLPDCLKHAQVIPIHNKNQNLKLASTEQSLFHQILISYSKKLSTKELVPSLRNNIVSRRISIDSWSHRDNRDNQKSPPLTKVYLWYLCRSTKSLQS